MATKTVDSASASASAGPVQRDGRSRIPATKMCRMAAEFTKKIAEWTSLRPTMALLRQRCRAGACAGIISSACRASLAVPCVTTLQCLWDGHDAVTAAAWSHTVGVAAASARRLMPSRHFRIITMSVNSTSGLNNSIGEVQR